MNNEMLKYISMMKEFNSELMELNIKYIEQIEKYKDIVLDLENEIERLNNIIHKAILELEKYENDNEANRYAPVIETLDILRGDE